MRAILCGLCVVAGMGTPALALTVEESVRTYVAPLVDSVDLPAGVAVGVYHRGKVTFYNYGVSGESREPVTERTIFEIGSVTKTFTAALLTEAVRAGTIDLNASIAGELPAGLTLRPAARAITPLELANFSSGLPDDPPGLPNEIALRGVDHYTVADFYRFLSAWEPAGPLPAPYLYSNTGVGLLGLILAGSIEGWEKQVADKITGPLAMTDTAVDPAPNEPARHAQGFAEDGRPAPKWPLYAWAAAGALRSTSADMVKFLAAHLGHGDVDGANAPPELLAAMADTRTVSYRISPTSPGYQALTWVVRKGEGGPADEEIVFKDGGTAGFSTFVGYNPAKDIGVVIIANWNHAPVVKTGIDVIAHVTGE